EHHGDGGGAPQQEHERIHQEGVPAEFGAQRGGERKDIDHRQLGLRVPADPEKGEGQERQARAVVQDGAAGKLVLEEEDAHQYRQADGQDGYLPLLGGPDLLPEGGGGVEGGRVMGGGLRRVLGRGGGRGLGLRDRRGRARIGLGQFVGQVEGDERLVLYAEYALHQELQAPRL